MKHKQKLPVRLLSFLLMLVLAVGQPLSAIGAALGEDETSPAFSQELVDYLTDMYGEEGRCWCSRACMTWGSSTGTATSAPIR